MKKMSRNPEAGHRRRDRVLAALEAIEGVIAADVEFGDAGAITGIRIVTSTSSSQHAIRETAKERLDSLGLPVPAEAIEVTPLGDRPRGSPPRGRPTTRPRTSRSRSRSAEAAPPAEPSTPPERPTGSRQRREPTVLVEDEAPPPPWHGRFLVLDGVDVHRRGGLASCVVTISRLGDVFEAEVEEIDTPAGRARSAARAALQAAESAGEGIRLSLEGVTLQDYFGRQYVLVFVDASAGRRFASLSGVLAVDNSVETAAVLAVLRAVERWVAW